ncbi:hypothetical protein TGVAND_267010 [Toxoplasma gondii VAND]|uniref:Uncharacterized protein n=1 Tax=Toxoplasma gondii VAND TaxID=933077 RepID=A0A086PN48_TOXGO|nr:hypothetical protein TGVAND_267010 [Toxoplasma gondii VAND]
MHWSRSKKQFARRNARLGGLAKTSLFSQESSRQRSSLCCCVFWNFFRLPRVFCFSIKETELAFAVHLRRPLFCIVLRVAPSHHEPLSLALWGVSLPFRVSLFLFPESFLCSSSPLEAFLQPSMHFGGRLGVLSTVLGRRKASFLCFSFLRDCLSRKFVLSPGRRNGHVFPWVWENDSGTSREEERKRTCLFPSRGCRSKCVSKRSSRRTLGLGLSFPFHLLSSSELHPKMHLNIYNRSMHVCMWKSLRLETQATLVPFVRNGQGEAPMWRWKNARKVLRTPQLLK